MRPRQRRRGGLDARLDGSPVEKTVKSTLRQTATPLIQKNPETPSRVDRDQTTISLGMMKSTVTP